MHFATLIVAAAVGVNCHPSGHNHRSFHAKRDGGGELVTATINGKVVTFTNSPWKIDKKPEVKAATAVPTKAPEPIVAAAPAPKEAAKESPKETTTGSGSTKFEAFGDCAGKRSPVDYTETSMADIMAVGNVGKCGYGSNIKLIANEKAMDNYKYGAKVTGGSKKLKCGAYNKIAQTGLVEGFFPKHFAKNFEVPANGEQWVAFDADFLGGIICSEKDEIPTSWFGLPTVSWAEMGFGDARNVGWNGFDASGLTPFDNKAACTALKVCAIKTPTNSGLDDSTRCSSINAGMACDGTNAYTAGTNDKGGLGSKVPPFADGEHLFLHVNYS